MRKRITIVLLFCLSGAAFANPVIFDPIGNIAFIVVLSSAIAVEAAAATLLLWFWGTNPTPVYVALVVANVIAYVAVFLPLITSTSSIWFAEAFIVVIDGIFIKAITRFDTVRDDTFVPVKWRYAFLIAAVGNIISYYVGTAVNS